MVKHFFRSNTEDLAVAVEGLTNQVTVQNRAITEMEQVIANLRQYNEAMEVRLHKQSEDMIVQLRDSFEAGIDNALQMFRSEIATLGKLTQPKEVVKAIEQRSGAERKLRQLALIKSRLEKVVAKYLMHDVPLSNHPARYKHPGLTPQGIAVYEAIGEFITSTAKIVGKNKEAYTSSKRYEEFFRKYRITPYDRHTVRKPDGKTLHTLLSVIIVNGHIRNYVDFIGKIHDEEVARIKGGRD